MPTEMTMTHTHTYAHMNACTWYIDKIERRVFRKYKIALVAQISADLNFANGRHRDNLTV